MRSIRSLGLLCCSWAFVLALAWPVSAPARGFLCEGAQVFVLEQTVDRTLLELRFDLLPRRQFSTEFFALAIPSGDLPQVRIVELNTVPLDEPLPVTSPSLFSIEPPQRARGQWIVRVSVNPIRLTAAGTVEQVLRAVVEFSHPSGAQLRSVLGRVALPDPGSALVSPATGIDELVASSVLNVETARLMRRASVLQRRAITDPVEDTFARSTRWLRLEVRDTGILRLDYATLRSAIGPDVDLVETASLRLFGAPSRHAPELPSDPLSSWRGGAHLRERPLELRAAGATFAPGDVALAYVPGADSWTDRFDPQADVLASEDHRGADRLAYWLTWDQVGEIEGEFDSAPLRMAPLDGSPAGATVVRTDARVRTHFEQNILSGFGVVKDDWMWRSLISIGSSEIFNFNLQGVVTDSLAWFSTEPGMQRTTAANDTLRARFELNGTVIGQAQWDRARRLDEDLPPFRWGTSGVSLINGANRLAATNATVAGPGTSAANLPLMLVDHFDLAWRHDLRWRGAALQWYVPAAEASSGRWRFELEDPQGRLGELQVYDVTDPWAPRPIANPTLGAGNTTLGFGVNLLEGQRRHFIAVSPGSAEPLLSIRRQRPRLLRSEVTDGGGLPSVGWDMVVLHPAEFAAPADRLVDLRRIDLPGRSAPRVTAVDVQDVYDQFGHGVKDPLAIRNYFKFLFEVDPRFEYVLLLGDASRDSRGYRSEVTEDFIPTEVADFFPRANDVGGLESLVPFAHDDGLAAFDDPPWIRDLGYGLDVPDLAMGRLPARSRSEADLMVQRILDYENAPAPGPWRNVLLLAADDEVGLGGPSYREDFHVQEAECVAEFATPPGLDVDKLYLTEFPAPPGDVAKRAAAISMRERWNEGRLIVHYVGHGAPEQLADEVLFRIEDVPTLSNGARLPLFLAFSCDVSIFDDANKRSMSEALVSQVGGGAIATIAATQVTYVGSNEDLTESFYAQLFPDPLQPGRPSPRVDRSAPLGRALMQSKWSVPNLQGQSGFDQRNNAKYVLLGDPALRLQSPTESVTLSGDLVESIRSGREQMISARIDDAVTASGSWYLEAKESADSVVYVMDKGNVNVPPEDLPYVLDGSTFFRGTGNFSGGAFEAALRAPAVMRFGDAGRVRVIMESGTQQSLGVVSSIDVLRVALDTDDLEGPAIELGFERGARRVQPGSVLDARIEDPSGVNVLGNAPAASILLEFDDSGISSDVTSRFELDPDSYTAGTLEVPLPEDIAPGEHVLVVTAGDMLGNVGSARLSFEVVAAGATAIGSHAPIPNPFVDTTNIVVEVLAPVGLGSDIEVDIRALDGAPVRKLRTSLPSGDGRLSLSWDGRDARGDLVANGTYLYVLRVRFATEPPRVQTSTGRVVLMR